jgi:putative ATP-dependent endonuclease of OLD family
MIYIKELQIRNFKSIKDETIKFNKGLNILVGPNNAGKTNIIEAIDLLLGDAYLPNFEPTTDHFFEGKENNEIIIEATLDCDNNELNEIIPEIGSRLKIRFRYSKSEGGFFEVNKNNQWECKYNKPFGYYWDFEKKLFFLRAKSLRNIMEIAPIRWKSPLKYFKEIIIKKAPEEKIKQVLEKIDEAKNELLKIDEVKDIISALLKISKDQTGIKNIYISPTSTKSSDIFNEMKILIDDGYLSEVTKKGLGTQNLIIISLFRVMAKYIRDEEKKFIIYGIDEPEIGLHPHAQRQLIFSLNNLSEYSQVIVTTHSNHLIDITKIDNIIRIDKKDNKTKWYKISLEPEEKKILEIHGRNLEEVFFAKRVLVVEGDTEEGFFPEASKKICDNNETYSFDYNSVSVINGQGDTIWLFIKLLKSFNIPFVVLFDNDKVDGVDKRDSFLKKLTKSDLIKEEEKLDLEKLDDENFKNALRSRNIFILQPFEKMISDISNEDTLNKIINAIKFVKEQWGYEIEDMTLERDDTDLKRKVFELLKKNKKWRIGKAIAQALEYNEIPNTYVEIIKKVSKL